MRKTVSMVVPCYNKENYIGAMLGSVLAQKWDRLELILVNDGSTDSTRQVIAAYEPKLKNRGFNVKIIDQKNGGCCAAVYSGLLEVSGDYFCLADCDDELHPEYISTMVGFLEENQSYDLCACSFYHVHIAEDGCKNLELPPPGLRTLESGIEDFMFHNTTTAVWNFMVRREYLIRCRLIENFYSGRSKTYEPLFAVPYLAGGGKLKHLDVPLYYYNTTAADLTRIKTMEDVRGYFGDKRNMFKWAIERLMCSEEYRTWLFSVLEGAYKYWCVAYGMGVREQEPREFEQCVTDMALWIEKMFEPRLRVDSERLVSYLHGVVQVLIDVMMNRDLGHVAKRVIWYGALGQRAMNLYSKLEHTWLRPDLLWDAGAIPQSMRFGMPVTNPNWNVLTESDLIIVCPLAEEVTTHVSDNSGSAMVLSGTKLRGQVAVAAMGEAEKLVFIDRKEDVTR